MSPPLLPVIDCLHIVIHTLSAPLLSLQLLYNEYCQIFLVKSEINYTVVRTIQTK